MPSSRAGSYFFASVKKSKQPRAAEALAEVQKCRRCWKKWL